MLVLFLALAGRFRALGRPRRTLRQCVVGCGKLWHGIKTAPAGCDLGAHAAGDGRGHLCLRAASKRRSSQGTVDGTGGRLRGHRCPHRDGSCPDPGGDGPSPGAGPSRGWGGGPCHDRRDLRGTRSDLPVGTVIHPEFLVEHTTGLSYRHRPPGNTALRGKLITTETVSLDTDLSQRFFADGCLAVDMESSAVAEVCEQHHVPWSVYRCISDRHFDGLLDARVVALANPDGSGNRAAIEKLLAEEPEVAARLERLSRDTARAAQLAAEAAVSGCRALDS